jgi:hypothetical protein
MEMQAGQVCAFCGSEPARVVSIRRHVGMLVLQQFFVNWFVLATNLVAFFQLRGLARPRPAMVADPVSSERWQSAFATSDKRGD